MTAAGRAREAHHLFKRVFEDRDWSWRSAALCSKPGPWSLEEWFYVERNADNKHADLLSHERKAKALCVRCPVREQCLEAGWKEEYGTWGGALPWERRRVRELEDRTEVLLMMLDDQAVQHGLVRRENVA